MAANTDCDIRRTFTFLVAALIIIGSAAMLSSCGEDLNCLDVGAPADDSVAAVHVLSTEPARRTGDFGTVPASAVVNIESLTGGSLGFGVQWGIYREDGEQWERCYDIAAGLQPGEGQWVEYGENIDFIDIGLGTSPGGGSAPLYLSLPSLDGDGWFVGTEVHQSTQEGGGPRHLIVAPLPTE